MHTVSVVAHLLGALRRAIGRVLLWFVVGGIVTAVVVEGVAYFAAGSHFPPTTLTNVAAAALAVAVAYAAALTVLVAEVVRFMIESLEQAEHDVKQEVATGGKVVEALVQGIEHFEKRV